MDGVPVTPILLKTAPERRAVRLAIRTRRQGASKIHLSVTRWIRTIRFFFFFERERLHACKLCYRASDKCSVSVLVVVNLFLCLSREGSSTPGSYNQENPGAFRAPYSPRSQASPGVLTHVPADWGLRYPPTYELSSTAGPSESFVPGPMTGTR